MVTMMSDDEKGFSEAAAPAPFTSQLLRNLAVEHLLENLDVYTSTEENAAARLVMMSQLMSDFAESIAAQALANRQNLSPLKTLIHLIPADPEQNASDGSLYELRYRVVESYGDAKPHRDQLLTFEEAVETYGESFFYTYWGRVGEHCPKRITLNDDRTLWFTTHRVPAASIDQKADVEQVQRSRPTQG
jgi:hypothetical protein